MSTIWVRFALAHCGCADHLLLLASEGYLSAHEAMPLAREHARKATEIDPLLPEATAMLGTIAAVYDYDWKEAQRLFLLAMSNEPVPSLVRQWCGNFHLGRLGRMNESIEQQELGLKDDPLNVIARITLGFTFINAGRLSDTQEQANKALALEKNQAWALLALALIYIRRGKWMEARRLVEKTSPLIPTIHASVGCDGQTDKSPGGDSLSLLQVGTKLGPYEVLALIGVGGSCMRLAMPHWLQDFPPGTSEHSGGQPFNPIPCVQQQA